MTILPPGEHAAAILAHYLKHLTVHAGLRWSPANDADMQTLAELLDVSEPQDEVSGGIPPYRPDAPALGTRVTQQLDPDTEGWRQFRIWQAQRLEDDRIEAARRMTRRR